MNRRTFLKSTIVGVVSLVFPQIRQGQPEEIVVGPPPVQNAVRAMRSLHEYAKALGIGPRCYVIGVDQATHGDDYTVASILSVDGDNVMTLIDSCVSTSQEEIDGFIRSWESRNE